MVRRKGLVRSVARTAGRTALIAGTATSVSRRVDDRHNRKAAQRHEPVQAIAAQAAPGAHDVVGQLQQLAELKASGALTDKEFSTAKARLLGP